MIVDTHLCRLRVFQETGIHLINRELSISIWIVSVVLLYSGVAVLSLLKRCGRSSVNAGEARQPFKLCRTLMFHCRRGALLRRLARLTAHEAKRTVQNLLKNLQAPQLEALALAVDSQGAEPAPCILLPADLLRLGRGSPALPPHVLFCQLYRWADLRTAQELRPLPTCTTKENQLTCINPFHYTRLFKPGEFLYFTYL